MGLGLILISGCPPSRHTKKIAKLGDEIDDVPAEPADPEDDEGADPDDDKDEEEDQCWDPPDPAP